MVLCLLCFHADPDCALHLNRPGPWHEHPPIGFYVCAHSLCHIQGVVIEDFAIDIDLLLYFPWIVLI